MEVKDALVDLYSTWGCDEAEQEGGLLSKPVGRLWKALAFAQQPDESNYISEDYHAATLAGVGNYVSRTAGLTLSARSRWQVESSFKICSSGLA